MKKKAAFLAFLCVSFLFIHFNVSIKCDYYELEIVDFYSCDRSGNFQWYFEVGSKVYFNLTIRNHLSDPKNVSISVCLFDELLDPIGGEFFDTTVPSNGSEYYIIDLTIPLWAHVGMRAFAYANIFEGRVAIVPEKNTNFCISVECTDVTVHVQDLWRNPVFAQVSIWRDGGRIVAKGYTDDLGNFNTSLIPGDYATKATNKMGSNSSTHHFDVPDTIYVVTVFSADVNDDGIVDIVDIVLCALAFGSKPGNPNWNPYADLNQDGKVTITDIVMIAVHFGETW